MTQVINLFAGPGVGKSTLAAGLFYEMKRRGMSAELVTEYAKDRVWEEHYSVFDDQLYVFAKQHRRMSRLRGKVDYIITDAPLFLSMVYGENATYDAFKPLVLEAFNSFNNQNFFLKRSVPYDANGRMQGLEDAKAVDNSILLALDKHADYQTIHDVTRDDVLDHIIAWVQSNRS